MTSRLMTSWPRTGSSMAGSLWAELLVTSVIPWQTPSYAGSIAGAIFIIGVVIHCIIFICEEQMRGHVDARPLAGAISMIGVVSHRRVFHCEEQLMPLFDRRNATWWQMALRGIFVSNLGGWKDWNVCFSRWCSVSWNIYFELETKQTEIMQFEWQL